MGSINMLGEGNVDDLNFVMGMKTTKFTKFCNQKTTRACLIPNPNHEIRKKQRHDMCETKNPIIFIAKKKNQNKVMPK